MSAPADPDLTDAIHRLADAVADLADVARDIRTHLTYAPQPAPALDDEAEQVRAAILSEFSDGEQLLTDSSQELVHGHIGWHGPNRQIWLSPTETIDRIPTLGTVRGAGQRLLNAGLITPSTEGGIRRATVNARLAGGRRRAWRLTPAFAAAALEAAQLPTSSR